MFDAAAAESHRARHFPGPRAAPATGGITAFDDAMVPLSAALALGIGGVCGIQWQSIRQGANFAILAVAVPEKYKHGRGLDTV